MREVGNMLRHLLNRQIAASGVVFDLTAGRNRQPLVVAL
jgi:hypothetical protein